jgi:hypothetical protein
MIYLPKKRRNEPEFQAQAALFTWSRNPVVRRSYPALDLLSCSLNGVKLTAAQAGKAKAAGLLKGEYDIKLPVSRGQYIGLIIEMKAGRNKPTPEQEWYGKRMKEEGWCGSVCWDWEDARDMIVWYLKQDRSHLFAAGGKIPTP